MQKTLATIPFMNLTSSLSTDTSRKPLRFLTCGSVDDGKSTLIGRLLYENSLIAEDQLAALDRDSKKHGTTDGVDVALLLDGLEAEREGGITIDVAYRYFSTERRSFVVADTPGHEQYTRNMATGASNCELAVILVDARKGILVQTRRHAVIASLLGLRHVVLAVNKMDLVSFDANVFKSISESFATFVVDLGFKTLQAIPVSARDGDNVSFPSERMAWYKDAALLPYLETIEVEVDPVRPFRMPVQLVCRPSQDFRGFAGTIADGNVHVGDEIAVLPSGRSSRIKQILTVSGEASEAEAGDAVTIALADEIDVVRGDLLTSPYERAQVSDQFSAHLVWMADEPLLPGRSYLMKINHGTVAATVTALKHRIDVNTFSTIAAKTLRLNDIGVCNISVTRPVAFDSYSDNRDTGSFILIDRYTNTTLAAGLIDFSLRRATNLHAQSLDVTTAERSRLMRHKPMILWFTGLSGAGKSTIANLVEMGLHARGVHTTILDGDNVRLGLNRDLGFTGEDRVENIRRVGEVAKLMTEAGLVVLCSFISPFRAERQMVRELVSAEAFAEIFVDASLETCISRDPKGLYRRARAGEIKNFTGLDQPYEVPERPELHLLADRVAPQQLADHVISYVLDRILL